MGIDIDGGGSGAGGGAEYPEITDNKQVLVTDDEADEGVAWSPAEELPHNPDNPDDFPYIGVGNHTIKGSVDSLGQRVSNLELAPVVGVEVAQVKFAGTHAAAELNPIPLEIAVNTSWFIADQGTDTVTIDEGIYAFQAVWSVNGVTTAGKTVELNVDGDNGSFQIGTLVTNTGVNGYMTATQPVDISAIETNITEFSLQSYISSGTGYTVTGGVLTVWKLA